MKYLIFNKNKQIISLQHLTDDVPRLMRAVTFSSTNNLIILILDVVPFFKLALLIEFSDARSIDNSEIVYSKSLFELLHNSENEITFDFLKFYKPTKRSKKNGIFL